MFNYLGKFYPAHSLWHAADPRSKLTVTLMLLLALVALSGVGLWLLLGLTLGLYLTSRLPLQTGWAVLCQFKWLLLFTLAANLCFFLFKLEFWCACYQTIEIGVKLVTGLLVAAWLCLVTKPLQLIDGWGKLLKPLVRLGLPVGDMGLFLSLVVRFVALLWREAEQIMIAQRLRGIRPGQVWRQGGLWLRSTLIPVFLATLRQAVAVATALEARGYRRGQPRSSLEVLHFKASDWVITLVALVGMLYFVAKIWL
jgi:energy-coupling factor transport system permease protein